MKPGQVARHDVMHPRKQVTPDMPTSINGAIWAEVAPPEVERVVRIVAVNLNYRGIVRTIKNVREEIIKRQKHAPSDALIELALGRITGRQMP